MTKDNLGLLPAQLAGVALLVDYVLTVSVSTAAGVQAISSVVPLAVPLRIVLSLAVRVDDRVRQPSRCPRVRTDLRRPHLPVHRESRPHLRRGHLPGGHGSPAGVPDRPSEASGGLPIGTAAVTAFLVLSLRVGWRGRDRRRGDLERRAGVPQARMAERQTTLVWMGLPCGSTFLAVSYLAQKLQVIPVKDDSKSVLAQIAQGRLRERGARAPRCSSSCRSPPRSSWSSRRTRPSPTFPRLPASMRGDAFMPRQLTKRGHRLVFSNGIVALAAPPADHRRVPPSVDGDDPALRARRLHVVHAVTDGDGEASPPAREKGWRFGLFVNGLGAVATFVVAVVIAIVKFASGAYIVMIAGPHPGRDPRPCEQDLRS